MENIHFKSITEQYAPFNSTKVLNLKPNLYSCCLLQSVLAVININMSIVNRNKKTVEPVLGGHPKGEYL